MSDLDKKIADAEKMRELEIRMHGLLNVDEKFTFYYDETNNIGKLYISETDELNVNELGNFVLGGVLLPHGAEKPNQEQLRTSLQLQATVTELKLKHIGRGDFLSILSSPKLTTYLEWLNSSGLIVHYQQIDLFYWSIVDIIDSILMGIPDLKVNPFALKNDLYEVVKAHRDTVIAIFSKYNYPDITKENKHNFLSAFLDLIERNEANLEHFNLYMLKGLFQIALKLVELPFIEGYPAKKLIENFYPFYFSRILFFKNSTHIFDENAQIQKHFENDEFVSSIAKGKYSFTRSHDEPLIQISDIFSGFIGKMYSYLTHFSAEEIQEAKKDMNEVSMKNLSLLGILLSKAEEVSLALIKHVASQNDIEKLSLLLSED